MRASIAIVSASLLIVGASCTAPARRGAAFQRQRLSGVEYRRTFEAASEALREHFRIARSDYENGIVRAVPSSTSVRGDGRRVLTDSLSAPQQARRVAEVRVRAHGPDVEVSCRVLVQRNDAAAVGMLSLERGGYDQPTGTPADRGAGTTAEQNAVWSKGTRDRAMERLILASIREKVSRSKPDGG